ncbi:hypothetical protein [Dyella nitratireducens]|uniref:Uncharacterized protein n=1 Tax=Dyella nitratireducens TaxID=1849580 RepID=A0ABQ1GIP9_9GAMM|nr:hypothetical protein [Dyella nitratireducens]GGA44319.1 hypothetical protein GCM10010981_36840 [Dyella nitratireducens]GLQ41759.1 hypothetical protein GCM10007902_16090 [Dyella nitratireducens]
MTPTDAGGGSVVDEVAGAAVWATQVLQVKATVRAKETNAETFTVYLPVVLREDRYAVS